MKKLLRNFAILSLVLSTFASTTSPAAIVAISNIIAIPILMFTPAGTVVTVSWWVNPVMSIWEFLDADSDAKLTGEKRPTAATINIKQDLSAKVRDGVYTREQADVIYNEVTKLAKSGALSREVRVPANTAGEYLRGIQKEANTSDLTTAYLASLMGLSEDEIAAESDITDLYF